jgi:hypothetical protein
MHPSTAAVLIIEPGCGRCDARTKVGVPFAMMAPMTTSGARFLILAVRGIV